MKPHYDKLCTTLRRTLEPDPRVLAAWQGGSAAWGATDQYSDLDLQVVIEDGVVEDTFDLVEPILRDFAPIKVCWRVPEPTWHGYSQCFYSFEGLPEWVYLDLCLLEASKLGRLNEVEHHGEPVVWFDKGSWCRTTRLDADSNRKAMEKRLAELEARHELFGHFVEKEIARDDPLAAGLWFDRMLFDPLVELLRMKHCPQRYSFGRRYLRRDLPQEIYERLSGLKGLPLQAAISPARQWIRELVAALKTSLAL